ncbi:hypothetical protein PR202_ga24569 [Eleusine coracana subsp. coracana]|uniref:Uncharacterized protein n=1 Tax=Eleusine coracana subsp. coracana TaxID=191504 RepID=A0AAV5D825_ELECO|nr:hypothetical protein PR202_ga24569 [Eleusine coracana subsp. coracana]
MAGPTSPAAVTAAVVSRRIAAAALEAGSLQLPAVVGAAPWRMARCSRDGQWRRATGNGEQRRTGAKGDARWGEDRASACSAAKRDGGRWGEEGEARWRGGRLHALDPFSSG